MANSALTLAFAVIVGYGLPAVATWGGESGMPNCFKVQTQSNRKGELDVPRRVTANGRGEAEDQEAARQRVKAMEGLFVTTEITTNITGLP